VIEIGQPEHSVVTTCAYCGVGCAFKAEMRGEEVVRMVPYKDGKANRGHSCVKGRFAWGYTTHKERILKPMIRSKITEPWREVSWDERSVTQLRVQAYSSQVRQGFHWRHYIVALYQRGNLSRQKLIRAGFGNNNVDTCARVCHSPTGYGLSQTFGTSAGTQDFGSVEHTDVVIIIGANPAAAQSRFRIAPEKAAARRREDDRDRSACDRNGEVAARLGKVSSAADARHQRGRSHGAGACDHH
jgi:formate dehydrogenase major subunit